jgi:hypothetical protein
MLDGLPRTVAEFEARFGSEERCEEYLRAKRWPKGFVCPKCQGAKAWALRARALDQCAACDHQVSLTAGTMFEGTRKPLVFWFRVIAQFVLSKSGCSAMDLHRQHGLAYQTAWTWLHKIRATMDRAGASPLKGIVQIDETFLGGEDPPERKGRSTEGKKTEVIAAVEEHGAACGRVRLEFAGGASGEELGEFIERNLEKGATARTDGLAAYRKPLAKHGCKHIAHVVGNGKNAPKLLPHVHRVFSLLRRLLLGTYQASVSVTHLKAYLDEFVFRFNRRNSKNRYLLVDRVLDAVFSPPPTYADLVGRARPQPVAST